MMARARAEGDNQGADAIAMRACIVCRARREIGELVRLRVRSGVVVVDGAARGRGASVCMSGSCLDKVDARGLSRAFRQPVVLPAAGSMRMVVACVAEQRIYALLGLARRQGVLIVGQDRVSSQAAGCIIIAEDASDRSRREVGRGAPVVFGSSDQLSGATGLHGVHVLAIAPGSLAQQAAYWLTVWYESRARERGMSETA